MNEPTDTDNKQYVISRNISAYEPEWKIVDDVAAKLGLSVSAAVRYIVRVYAKRTGDECAISL